MAGGLHSALEMMMRLNDDEALAQGPLLRVRMCEGLATHTHPLNMLSSMNAALRYAIQPKLALPAAAPTAASLLCVFWQSSLLAPSP